MSVKQNIQINVIIPVSDDEIAVWVLRNFAVIVLDNVVVGLTTISAFDKSSHTTRLESKVKDWNQKRVSIKLLQMGNNGIYS